MRQTGPEAGPRGRAAKWLLVGLAVSCLAAAALLWKWTPLAAWAAPERVAGWLAQVGTAPSAWVAVVGVFVAGGLVLFPLLLLITATAMVFEPVTAVGLSFAGTMASASATYGIGAKCLRATARDAFGMKLARVHQALQQTGVIAVAIVRTIPLAPFTVVNVVAGSIGVRFRDYLIGTALGVAPGIVMLTAFGRQLRAVFREPTTMSITLLFGVVASWIALSLMLQRAVAHRKPIRA